MLPLMEHRLVFFDPPPTLDEADGLHPSDEPWRVGEQGTFDKLQEKKGYFTRLMNEMRGEKENV